MSSIRSLLAAGLFLACVGCDSLNEPLGDSSMLMDPIMGSGVPATSAAGLWGAKGLLGYHIGMATPDQKRLAESKGRQLLAQESVKRQVAEKKIKYVAVAVQPTASQITKQKKASPAIVKVSTESGKADESVYSPEGSGKLRSGGEVSLGGDPTLFFATSGDQV